MSANYELRPTTPGDAEGLNVLYKKLTGVDRSVDAWRWEWREGPLGMAPSFVIVERATGHIAGHHGVVPLPIVLGRRQIRAARTENSMVDPDHKGKYIYPAYEAQILAELLKSFDLIFTTAGKGAAGVVRKRLGYVERGHWHTFSPGVPLGHIAARLVKGSAIVGPIAGVLERRAPHGMSIEETSDLARLAQLWSASTRAERLAPDRTAAFLDWRITRHPKTRYRAGLVLRAGSVDAAIIWRDEDGTGSTRHIVVEDLFTGDDSMEAAGDAIVTLAAHYRGRAARISLRTLNDESPLASAARLLTPPWAIKGGAGSPVFVRSPHDDLLRAPWTMTQLLTQGN